MNEKESASLHKKSNATRIPQSEWELFSELLMLYPTWLIRPAHRAMVDRMAARIQSEEGRAAN